MSGRRTMRGSDVKQMDVQRSVPRDIKLIHTSQKSILRETLVKFWESITEREGNSVIHPCSGIPLTSTLV